MSEGPPASSASMDAPLGALYHRLLQSLESGAAEALEIARSLAYVRPLLPYPGWTFSAGWDDPAPEFAVRRRIWELFRDRKLDRPFIFDWYDGLRLYLYLGNDLSRQLYIAGCVEPNEFAFLGEILTPGMVFIDAGANDGLYTLFASHRVGPGGQVWAFEPSQREFNRLQQNVALNHAANVRAFPVALAGQNGEARLSVAGPEHQGVNTLGSFVHNDIELLRTERVPIRKLDDLVSEANLQRIDVMKLDVEGAEFLLLEGARNVLARFQPVVLFEASGAALRQQGSSLDQLFALLTSSRYQLFAFDATTGCPRPLEAGPASDNMIAIPSGSDLARRFASSGPTTSPAHSGAVPRFHPAPAFSPAAAYWNQRLALAKVRDRIRELSQVVSQPYDLWPFQWAQLMAAVMEYQPDLILELGRDAGNSTVAFTEASNLNSRRSQILSLCLSPKWERETAPRLRAIVPPEWFQPLRALRADILRFDYQTALAGKQRVLIFWDAHGFDIAECVLGRILPIVSATEHVVIMHDLSDTRYSSENQLEYGEHGLWKGNDWSGPRVKLGVVDSAAEQSIAALDFTTRNHLTLDSADHSFHTELAPSQQAEMQGLLGDLFSTQAHWFYFSLNERPGPYKFPRFTAPRRSFRFRWSRR